MSSRLTALTSCHHFADDIWTVPHASFWFSDIIATIEHVCLLGVTLSSDLAWRSMCPLWVQLVSVIWDSTSDPEVAGRGIKCDTCLRICDISCTVDYCNVVLAESPRSPQTSCSELWMLLPASSAIHRSTTAACLFCCMHWLDVLIKLTDIVDQPRLAVRRLAVAWFGCYSHSQFCSATDLSMDSLEEQGIFGKLCFCIYYEQYI